MRRVPGLPGTPASLLAALFVVAVLSAASPAASQGVETRTAADLARLQGRWEGSGPGGECSVTISGNSLNFYAREDHWFETTFTLPAGTEPPQLHATIVRDSSPDEDDIGTVVVAVFKVEGEKLTLGVIEDFDGPPTNPVTGEWEWAMDVYHLEKAQPRESQLEPPANEETESAPADDKC